MTPGAARPSLQPMLEARSVAIVGAGNRPGSFGYEMVRQLRTSGFDGAAYAVNRNGEEVAGMTCVRAIEDLPEAVDLAVLGVGNRSLEEALCAAGERGCRAAVIFASCREHAGAASRPPLGARLAAIAQRHGMSLCGGNCMGFVNIEGRLRATGYSQDAALEAGGVTFLTHSGSAFSALLRNRRGIRFNLAVSSGDELVTTMADYLMYAVDRPSTRVVALFLETVHDPPAFRAALDAAADRDIAVVALKVGRGELARDMVTAHSGALAGDDAAYEALFAHHGVLRVRGLDEMIDTVELLSAGRVAAAGGLATVHDSGGERTHLIDVAETIGVALTRVTPETSHRLAAVLGPDLPPLNPVDAWTTGEEAQAMFVECLAALHDDPGTAAVALAVDLVADENPDAYPAVATDVAARTTKPFFVLSNVHSSMDQGKATALRAGGIPVLEGTESGLRAVGHLLARRDWRAHRGERRKCPATDEVRAAHWSRVLSSGVVDESTALTLVAAYGVPVIATCVATSHDEVRAAAAQIGWPVALKTAEPGVAHKSEHRGVHLGIRDAGELESAYADLRARLGSRVVVQAMAPAAATAVELHVGIAVDAQFGPLVVLAAGGVLVEVLGDRAVMLPPLDAHDAHGMLDGLRIRGILEGTRGRPATARDAVVAAVLAVSQIAVELGDRLAGLDVNPLIASERGCVAVDALVIPAKPEAP